ncbi:transcriptional regulator [Paenibacillus sp. Soil766]|uniref:TetR/AcrR family transcriptional regulator n=1 Tax=Paenibacillus sp. Soil766 TaxID=1736404 RepID=UPI00070C026F|nr:TetR/AcrR family transcriptional regulator [Paenibacillus sp. Soil766]KRE82427.1 transcriptional regulator [Paenibacillus sp. Soil766]
MNNHTVQPPKEIRIAITYQEARLQHTENLKQNVVEAAAILLQEGGPEAVTVRRVADKMACSTKIIYSLFGSKDELAKQLYLEGCKLLAQSFEVVPKQNNPQQSLWDLGSAYWSFGVNYSSYYKMMFGGAITFKQDEESLQGTVTALKQVLNVLEEAVQQELIEVQDLTLVIFKIWTSLHGVIHLYLGGHLHNDETARVVYDQTLSDLIQTIFGIHTANPSDPSPKFD